MPKARIVGTILTMIVYWLVMIVYNPVATLLSAGLAGQQFESVNNPLLYVSLSALSGAGAFITLIACLILLSIWMGPIRRGVQSAIKKMMAGVTALLLLTLATGNDSQAFFEKADRTEAYTIMPNESAFWIPDIGDNKNNQAQLESEAYLNANKLAVKRFIIPHAKLSNSGGWLAWDYYVPSGRLIIVDRTPYSREWVDAHDRGTSATKQGFPCQTKEGLNVTAGVSIGTSVYEKDAAKFLYRFGVTPPKGDRTDGQVIFTSVYYGRSLREVMDDVGRKKVQTLVCAEISARTFDKANEDTNAIMVAVEKAAKEYFATVGITLDFVGWADTFSFDADVQKVVNDYYAAQKLAQTMPILSAIAQLKVQEGLGKGLGEKGPPIVVTPGMIDALTNLAKPTPAQ